jgi:hypothetical protein
MGISDDKTGIVARTSGAVLMRTKLGSVRTSIGHNGTHIRAMFGGMGGNSDMIVDVGQASNVESRKFGK